jgi:hypothetical protein
MGIDVSFGWFNLVVFLGFAFVFWVLAAAVFRLFVKDAGPVSPLVGELWLATLGGGIVTTLIIMSFEKWWLPLQPWIPAMYPFTIRVVPKLAMAVFCVFIAGTIAWLGNRTVNRMKGGVIDDGLGIVFMACCIFLLVLWFYKLAYVTLGVPVPLMTQQILGWFSWLFTNS